MAQRLSKSTEADVDPVSVLLLWARAHGAVVVSAAKKPNHVTSLANVFRMPDVLLKDEIEEITHIGKTIHFRHYTKHMERDFPLPSLPSGT